MRSGMLVLLLALAAGGLLVLVLGQEPPPQGEEALEVGPDSGGDAPRRKPPAEEPADRSAPVEVVAAGNWPKDLDEDSHVPLAIDSRLIRAPEVEPPTSGPWKPTGKQVLEVLSRELAGKAALRFESKAALERFRAATWKNPIPSPCTIILLLESCHEVGFHPELRGDAVYFVQLEGS